MFMFGHGFLTLYLQENDNIIGYDPKVQI
jgi:hypothetical protein